MADGPPTGRRIAFITAFGACAMLVLAALSNVLVHNDYPLLRLEVLLVALAIVLLSLAAALLCLALPWWGRPWLEGLLAALFVELTTTSLPLALIVGLAVAAVTLWKRMSLTGPMTLFGAIVLITTLLGLGGRTPWIHSVKGSALASAPEARSLKPAVLHIILDEQIGIEGLPDTDADALRLKNELKTFYRSAGFATYGGAYSEYMRTMNAIPNILNYGKALGEGMRGRKAVIGPTKHLERLVDQGYRLTILQSDYADFCTGARYYECVTYEVSSPSALIGSPLTALERAGLITTKFLSLSQLVSGLMLPWRLAADLFDLPKLGPSNLGRSTSVPSLAVFDDLAKRLSGARAGEVYFAHLLLPHYPYAVDENCQILRWKDWKKPFSPKNITVRQHAYFAQYRCTIRKIAAALKALDRSPAGKNTVVIIHGDHGSRISLLDPKAENLGKLSDSDFIAEFSTNFAVRSPSVMPSYSSDRRPVQLLLADFVDSGFSKAPAPKAPQSFAIYLDGPEGAPGQRMPLPASWANR